jgi:mono/diheme cytochrome c family protein
LEALWVSWGLNKVDQTLLRQMLTAKDYKARAAAVQVLRYTGHQVKDQAELLMQSAKDENGRVRLQTIVAASWLPKDVGLPIVMEAGKLPLDQWMVNPYEEAIAHLNGVSVQEKNDELLVTTLTGKDRESFVRGKAIYAKDGYCSTCHQPDGAGLSASSFPPLAGTNWVVGNEERLIKLVMKGLQGPVEILGKNYPGQVPMTPFGGLLNDEEIADVLTYVRNSFGNKASVISPAKVGEVRAAIKNKTGFYSPDELVKEHPLEK